MKKPFACLLTLIILLTACDHAPGSQKTQEYSEVELLAVLLIPVGPAKRGEVSYRP